MTEKKEVPAVPRAAYDSLSAKLANAVATITLLETEIQALRQVIVELDGKRQKAEADRDAVSKAQKGVPKVKTKGGARVN